MGDKSRTGRTTRMIEEAKRLAAAGRAVYVLTASYPHARALQSRVDRDMPGSGIKCEVAMPDFDWGAMEVRGCHPSSVFLVDHFAIEHRFQLMLAMLDRYNEPEQITPDPEGKVEVSDDDTD